MKPLVYIIILNWNGWQDSAECVESVLKITYSNYRVLIVDNGSTNDSVKILAKKFPNIEILETGKNLGYAGGNNRGIEKAIANEAEYVFILNNDTKVDKNFLQPLVQAMEGDKQIGITGGTVYYYDNPDVIHNMGGYTSLYTGNSQTFGLNALDRGQFNNAKEVPQCCGGAMLIRASLIREIGGFNEKFFIYYDEPDICFRTKKAGYKVTFAPGSKIYHKIGRDSSRESGLSNFYGLRNRIWIERMYANKFQYFIFNLYLLFYLLPRILLGHIFHKRLHLLKIIFLAVWKGYFQNPW
ncbi:hypothetical protein ES703_10244 [subsurface metagenome]